MKSYSGPQDAAGAPSHAPRTPTKPDSRPDNIPLSKPAPGAAGLLGFVGLAHVAVGAIACFAPQKDVGFALDGPGNEALLQRCVGMGGILTATAALGLCQLTRVGMQDVPEGDALSLALLSAGTAGLLSLSAADTLPSTGAGWGLLAATTALPAVRILSSPAVRARMWQGITSWLSPSKDAHPAPKSKPTTATRGYQLITPALAVAGIAYAVWPAETLQGVLGLGGVNPTALQAWRDVGVGIATVAPAISWSLQRHARDGALLPLGSKILNGGLMAVALLHLAYLGPHWYSGSGGEYILAPLALWGATGVATLLGVKEGLEEMLG